jgi:hypothetical protein
VVKAVNATIPCDTAIDSKGYKPLINGDKIRIDITDVGNWSYVYLWSAVYLDRQTLNDTAITWQNGMIFNVSLNEETLWENVRVPSLSQVFPSSLDLYGWIFHAIGGNGYWNSFGNWSDSLWNTGIDTAFSLAINDGVVALYYDDHLGDRLYSQVSKDTGVFLERHSVSSSASAMGECECDLKIIDSNIPGILDLPLSPMPLSPRVPTELSCSISKNTITQGDGIVVSGSINVSLSGKTVTLTYKKPDESTLNRTVTTGSDGSYSDSYTPDAAGSWSVTASWIGDSLHNGATSSTRSLTVNSVTFILFTPFGIALMGGAIILIIIIIVVLMRGKSKIKLASQIIDF